MADLKRVELFEDRTALTWVAEVQTGRQTLRIGPVSPLVDPSRCSAPRLAQDAAWVVEDLRIENLHRAVDAADSDVLAALRATAERARDAWEDVVTEATRLEERRDRARAALEAAHAQTGVALQAGEDARRWIVELEQLATDANDAAHAMATLRPRVAEARREHDRCRQALEAARVGTSVTESTLVVELHAETAGTIRVRAIVPCGLWRPVHRAVLEGDEVHWSVGAACWNATGIDWEDVQLVCSTARPGQHADPPQLTDDRVETQRRNTEIDVEAREERIEHARPEGGVTTSTTLPGVDDGGEVRVYEVPESVTVPSDGRPVFVTLETFTTPAERSWRAIPLLLPTTVLRTAQRNGGRRPLLAGPVELVRDGIAVGRTTLKLTPAGERFELGWGNHDGVRVVRRADHEVDKTLLTGAQTHTFEVQLRVSHLGPDPVDMCIDERIPVSELKQVQVSIKEAVPALQRQPDEDGLCGWQLTLQPHSTSELKLVYTVTAPKNINLPF